MVSKMNRVTIFQLLFYLGIEGFLVYMIYLLFYEASLLKNYFICISCFVTLIALCVIMYKIIIYPFWIHFKLIKFEEVDIIYAKIDKLETKVVLADRGADIYKIVAYYNDDGTTYVFKDVFYYNDPLFAKRINKIIEHENLPEIDILIERSNKRKYKIKGCEYFVNLKYMFSHYF